MGKEWSPCGLFQNPITMILTPFIRPLACVPMLPSFLNKAWYFSWFFRKPLNLINP